MTLAVENTPIFILFNCRIRLEILGVEGKKTKKQNNNKTFDLDRVS